MRVLLVILLLAAVAAVAAALGLRRRRQAEAALWQDADRIAELTRAGAMDELEQWLERELGEPVAALLNNLAAARRLLGAGERDAGEQVTAALDEACADAERTALALRRVHGLLGSDDGRREPVPLEGVVNEAVLLVKRRAAGQGVRIVAALAPGLPPAQGHRGQLLELVLALVLRAVDNAAAAPHREVRITAALSEGAAPELVLAVNDSGPCLSEVERAHLNAPLSSTRAGGLALSVARVRAIAEAHGGRVVVGRPGAGARVELALPVEAAPPADGAAEAAS